jgi:hypothetical protein
VHRGKTSFRSGIRALSRAAWSIPALAVALSPGRAAFAQVTGNITGYVTGDYSSSLNAQGQTVYGFDDAYNGMSLSVPTVPVMAAVSAGQESWSAPATWNGGPIYLFDDGVIIYGNLSAQAGAYLNVPVVAYTLTEAGPTNEPVIFYGVDLESTAVPGVNAAFTLSSVISFDATIPAGADVDLDQQGVTVQDLAINCGGTLAGSGNYFNVNGNLTNQGILSGLSGGVNGNFCNASSGNADITAALYLQGNLSNYGTLSLEQYGSLNLSLAAANDGVFNLYGGSINPSNGFTNNGQFNWYSGELPNITNSFTGTFSILTTASKYLPPGGTLTNAGAILQVGANTTFAIDGDYNTFISQAFIATVNNLAGAVYNLDGDGQVTNQTSGYGFYGDSVFNNAGLFEKTAGTGTSVIGGGITFNNSGTVEVNTGALRFDGGGSSNTAAYVFNNGGQIVFDSPFTVTGLNTGSGSGALTVINGGSLIGTGTLNFGPANLIVSDQSTIGGGLTNAGQLTVDATTYDAYVTGTFTNTGTIQHVGGTFQINPASTLNNYGTIQQIGSNTTVSIDGNYNYILSSASPSTLNNFAGAVYNIQANGGLANPTSSFGLNPDAAFNNYGLFEKTGGAGVSDIGGGITFNNTGSILVSSGTLEFDGGVVNSGSLTVSPGTRVTFNGPLTGGAGINNQGWVYVNAGGSISGNISGNGGLAIGLLGNPTTLQLAPYTGTTRLSALSINPNSTLDITNNTVAVTFGSAPDPVATIAAELADGYNNGAWTGAEILSSTAAAAVAAATSPLLSVGYADGNTDNGTAAAANQVLIKFTLGGDAYLAGTVNFNDLDVVGRHLNTTGNDWADGNFNYDPNGAVNFNDLDIIGQNLNKALGALGSSGDELGGTTAPLGLSANVQNTIVTPEPGVIGIVAIAAGLLARRRRLRRV